MARTKVITVTTTAGGVVTGSQTPDQTPDQVQNEEAENEETKQSEPGDIPDDNAENNFSNERGDRDVSNSVEETKESEASDALTPQVTALTTFMQQLAATVARMDARLDQLSTNNTATAPVDARGPMQTEEATTSPSGSRPPPPATGATGRSPPALTSRHAPYQPPHDGDDGGDDASSDGDDSLSSSDESNGSGAGDGGRGRRPARMSTNRAFLRDRRRTIRDLDLPTFLPTPETSVSTWMARVDLALEGARVSGRGDWTNEELYYILGNKLQASAARWWVQQDRKLRDHERTWTRLKSSLLRRYGERPDKSMAEWRISQRRMLPGETYADFAASLRDLCGNNRIKERVLLAQFYRCLDKTTRLLVKQRPKPRTLEEAVDKATEIDDPIDNVARGMENIGQPFVTAPATYVVSATGTTGHMTLIPGVGSAEVTEEEKIACFTNSRGVYNKFTGLWEAPKGREWNGRIWAPRPRNRAAPVVTPPAAVAVPKRSVMPKTKAIARINMAAAADCDSEEFGNDDYEADTTTSPPPCYACGDLGHFARECPDEEARARNDEYLAKRNLERQAQGNENRASPWAAKVVGNQVGRTDVEASSATVIGNTSKGMDGMDVPSNEWGVAAIRRVVNARLDEELAAGDSERAKRYVGTVRPAMTALRYQYSANTDYGKDGRTEEGAATCAVTEASAVVTRPVALTQSEGVVTSERGGSTGDVAVSEDGGATGDVTVSEEGGNVVNEMATALDDVSAELATLELGLELTDEMMVKMGSVAKVRRAAKQSRRGAKQRRVQQWRRKQAKDVSGGDEVTRAVAELEAKRVTRRQRHVGEAREALIVRREQRAVSGEVRASEHARVNLVQRNDGMIVTNANGVVGASAEASDGLPTAEVLVDGMRRHVKIDSGARYSVAGTDWMLRGERKRGDAPVECVEGIGGFLLDVLGVWAFDMVNVYGQNVKVEACIVEGCTSEFLMGVDFLERHRAIMDFDRGEVRYDERGHEVIIPFRTTDEKDDPKVAAVRLASATNLHKRAVQPVEVAIAAPDGEVGIFMPTVDNGAVMLAAAVTKAQNGKALIPAVNAYGGRIKLPSRKELGVWIPVKSDIELLESSGELGSDRVQAWLDVLGDTTTPLDDEDQVNIGTDDGNARTLVIKLLRAYRSLTNAQEDCPPATTLDVEHHIDTGDAAPVMMKRRRQAQTEDAVVDNNVDAMLSAGVIERGNGAWGFPVVLTLESLGGARLFTTLDLKAGYWQIRVAKEDRDKTAFTTKRGLYRFKRMPFGLTNAPATFQRLMNGVLRGLTWLTCLVYLDDIIIFTRGGIGRHVVELAGVLERLRAAGLSLKLKKCTFATTAMEYLGHHLSSRGVQPADRLVTAVRAFPRPADTTESNVSYTWPGIIAFGSIVEPLTRLLKKDVLWEWTEAQEFAFTRIKILLTTQPLLLYPNFELPFRLVTDASKVGLGACLQQDHGHGWQPIAYASKVNSHAEANYSITELECAAVVWSVKHFRPYLYGRTFTIVTDHSALRWLMTRPNLAGRLHRWSLTLQEYEFDILYRPGATNVVADALSRAPAAVLMAVGRRGRATRRAATKAMVPMVLTSETTTIDGVARDAETGGVFHDHAADGNATDEQVVNMANSTTIDAIAKIPATVTAVLSSSADGLANAVAKDDATAGDAIKTVTVTGSKRARKAAVPATRRSARIQGRAQQHVHWAATVPDTIDEVLNAGRPTTTENARAMATTGAPDRALEQGRAQQHVHWAATVPDAIDEVLNAGRPTTTENARAMATTGAPDRALEMAAATGTTERTETRTTPGTTSRTKTPTKLAEQAPSPRMGAVRADERRATKTTTGAKAKAPTRVKPTPPTKKRATGDNLAENLAVAADGTSHLDDMGDDSNDVPAEDYTLQVSDDEVMAAQKSSKFVKRLMAASKYGSMEVANKYGLVTVKTANGWRVVLPPTLWSAVFKEMHGSVWSGHLRGAHTYGRVAQLYWWPGLYREVKRWVRGCQECGSRKAKPREVIPPLRSLRGGAVGDRWALDVAGPFPVADGGDRYVIAAVEYITRYAVASCVTQHTAENVATFLMQEVVLRFGVFRELLTDGAPELAGKVIEELVQLLQAHQVNPVPYRPQFIGLVERFHRTWKDCVSTFMQDERQPDWNLWVKFAVYSYNSARHSTVALSPNELMMGRRLRAPNELLRRTEVMEAGELPTYHVNLLQAMARSHECAEQARQREQVRQARYYNRRTRNKREFRKGDLVWMYNPPRGKNATKFVHQWMGPLRILDPAGYDNFLLTREDRTGTVETVIAHVSFLISYHYPEPLLAQVARDIDEELAFEDQTPTRDGSTAPAPVLATTADAAWTTQTGGAKRVRTAAECAAGHDHTRGLLVERRRRRRRNRAGQYILEYELYPCEDPRHWTTGDGHLWLDGGRTRARWTSVAEYERLYRDDRVVEDPGDEEVV
ncbi:hypothetical protein PHMEG_0009390 [Phytophthora megakarya]|uniref:RNA-directed DNA polymerase n=1 Tax=Phytophthora megakarya TaxID=4795 RepID=A0A225WHQ4_9STRA|nr:hypothetical protein PHMEG_0009390 [Phytophthora megakarya]